MANLAYLGGLKNNKDFGIMDNLKETGLNLFNRADEWIVEPKEAQDLKLHIYGAETMNLSAEITDNYVESNIAYQDHIALKPNVFTIAGEVGELTWYKKDAEESMLPFGINQKLQPIVAFLPPVSKKVQKIQDKTLKLLSVIDSLDNFANRLWNMLSGDDVNTEQKKIYKYLMCLWRDRKPINIKTPYGKMKNYAIQNIEFTQPERTEDKTQIKISFKQIREVVSTKVTAFNKSIYQLRAAAQKATKESIGTTTGIKMTIADTKPGQVLPPTGPGPIPFG